VLGSSKISDEQKETAALNFPQKPPLQMGVSNGLLYDGFFSFAVVRQIILYSVIFWLLSHKDHQEDIHNQST